MSSRTKKKMTKENKDGAFLIGMFFTGFVMAMCAAMVDRVNIAVAFATIMLVPLIVVGVLMWINPAALRKMFLE